MQFKDRLKELRSLQEMTQEDLALQINAFFNTKINNTTISKLENGNQKPTVDILEMFAIRRDIGNTPRHARQPGCKNAVLLVQESASKRCAGGNQAIGGVKGCKKT